MSQEDFKKHIQRIPTLDESFSKLFQFEQLVENDLQDIMMRHPQSQLSSNTFVQQKNEIEKIKQQLNEKERKYNQMKQTIVKPERYWNQQEDISASVQIANEYLVQVQQQLRNYKEILESLRNIKQEQVHIWPLFDSLKEILKYQYKIVKDLGANQYSSESKKILRTLQENTQSITIEDDSSIHLESIKKYLNTIRQINALVDRGQADFRDLQYRVVQKIPPLEKYRTSENTIFQVQNFISNSLDEVRQNWENERQILVELEKSKNYAITRNKNDLIKSLRAIIPVAIQLTKVTPKQQ